MDDRLPVDIPRNWSFDYPFKTIRLVRRQVWGKAGQDGAVIIELVIMQRSEPEYKGGSPVIFVHCSVVYDRVECSRPTEFLGTGLSRLELLQEGDHVLAN